MKPFTIYLEPEIFEALRKHIRSDSKWYIYDHGEDYTELKRGFYGASYKEYTKGNNGKVYKVIYSPFIFEIITH